MSYLQSRRFDQSRKNDFGHLRGGCGARVRRHDVFSFHWGMYMSDGSLTSGGNEMTYGWRMPVVSMRAQDELLLSSDIVVIRWHSWP